MIDVTDRWHAEERLREKEEALDTARTELARVSRVTTLGGADRFDCPRLDVFVFASPQEFLQAKHADAPGCVVLDVRMPGMKRPSRFRTSLPRWRSRCP